MNKVITVNLNGNGYQLEEGGYDALRRYLENARASLATNPDCEEILADIEHAVAERFRAQLGPYKTVVSEKEVREALYAVGPVDDGSEAAAATPPPPPPSASGQNRTMPPPPPPSFSTGASTGSSSQSSSTGASACFTPRRLYRFNDGAIFAGVCRGLSVYFDLDVTLVRLLFVVVAAISAGLGLVAYFVMAFSVPLAETPEEKAAAQGGTPTAQDFVRRAKEGYYEAMKDFPDKEQRRAWKKRFKHDVRAWSNNLRAQIEGNAAQWSRNWNTHWSPPAQPHALAWIAIPVLSILSAALVVFSICVVISILKTGAVFGLALPASLPVWLSIPMVFALFSLIEWPLKAARFQLWSGGRYGAAWEGPRPSHAVFVWFVIFCSIAWFVYPHQTQEFIHKLPPFIHRAFDSISAWWNQK
jgi:phage shock protein PspC (stress-responsive transcriptional regulator)